MRTVLSAIASSSPARIDTPGSGDQAAAEHCLSVVENGRLAGRNRLDGGIEGHLRTARAQRLHPRRARPMAIADLYFGAHAASWQRPAPRQLFDDQRAPLERRPRPDGDPAAEGVDA